MQPQVPGDKTGRIMSRTHLLRPGDTVAIVAPSGPFPADRYERGLAVLRERGYRVKEFLPPQARRYLAGSDEERIAGLRAALLDAEVRAIFTARGGYGAMRMLPAFDWAEVAGRGKTLIGFSDVTALHLPLQKHGARSVHGPVVTRLGEEPPHALDRLFSLLETDRVPAPIEGRTVVSGEATGPLIGGCLSVLSRLVGTPYLPEMRGAILLLEDVGERPYRLDRMWTHLQLAGLLEQVSGVVVGDLTSCDEPGKYGAWEVVDELLAALGKPAIAGLPIGHGPVHLSVPLGARVSIEGGALRFHEGL